MRKLRILVACEESQAITKEFRKLGHEAFSCDLQDCSGGHPEWHIKGDCLPIIYFHKWDLIIAHPPCTYLCITGNRWFNAERYGDKARQRMRDREEAIHFFMEIIKAPCDHIAVENPIGVMSTVFQKPTQIIHPWQFGDPYEKPTCLWLKGLPPLKPTNIVSKGEYITFPSGRKMPKWYKEIGDLPIRERGKLRSKTFPGIAKAIAEQWSEYLTEGDNV